MQIQINRTIKRHKQTFVTILVREKKTATCATEKPQTISANHREFVHTVRPGTKVVPRVCCSKRSGPKIGTIFSYTST